ncbi:hypothetical protein BGW80DRAFT_1280424 [Lactifluus volemus]|nr:hypothetical protein BGW80DRAFT_1280424 [Lactifluus volemus]
MVPKYTAHNRSLNTSTTVTVAGFDAHFVNGTVARGTAACRACRSTTSRRCGAATLIFTICSASVP